jgi:hypothetical protein
VLFAWRGWLHFKMIGAHFGGSVVGLAELGAAAETRATEIILVTLRIDLRSILHPIGDRFFG